MAGGIQMPAPRTATSGDVRVTGHLQVKTRARERKWHAHYVDHDGIKRTKVLGLAHVRDSGRRTARGAVVWRSGDGRCPDGSLTPKMAEDALAALLDDARRRPRRRLIATREPEPAIPTFGDAVAQWLRYLRVEKGRKRSTLRDARNAASRYLLPRFGADTPLCTVESHEVLAWRGGRERWETREERHDTITTDDVDDFRRDLLDSHLSQRTVQKILVLLHGVMKLAKRRSMIANNPCVDAERVTPGDDGTFNILEPIEFEAVYRAVLGGLDERPDDSRERDAIDQLSPSERDLFGALLSTSFYAGPRLGEVRDLPWRNVDFAGALIRIESGFVEGERSTPKGGRARSVPLVSPLDQRLAAVGSRENFAGAHDYVFCTELGGRVSDTQTRAVFYAALERAGLGHKRAKADVHGNPQEPIRVHDLRHSFCTWAVNVWPITKVQEFAGHADIKTTRRYVHHQTKAEDAELGGAYLARVLGVPAEGAPTEPAGAGS
jgi:integrase